MIFEPMKCNSCSFDHPPIKMFRVELLVKKGKVVWLCEQCYMNRQYDDNSIPRDVSGIKSWEIGDYNKGGIKKSYMI